MTTFKIRLLAAIAILLGEEEKEPAPKLTRRQARQKRRVASVLYLSEQMSPDIELYR